MARRRGSQRRGSKRRDTVAAQVFLRSVSGRSIKEIAGGPLPDDLAPFRPTEAARTAVQRFLAAAGFEVHGDEMGFTLSIEASPADFARVFGIDASRITKVSAQQTLRLPAPAEIQDFVEDIAVLPKPEFFC